MIFSKKIAVRSRFVVLEAINFGLKPLYTSLISLFVIRWFDLQLWGSFVFYLLAIQLFITFLNWGQKPYLMKLFSANPNKIGEHWGKTFIARIPLLFLVMCFIVILPKLQIYLIPLSIWVVFKWLIVMLDSFVQFNRDYTLAVKAELLAIIGSIVFLLFKIQKVDLELLIYLFAFSNALKFVAMIPILLKNNISIPSFKVCVPELLVCFPLFALTLAGMFQTKGDLYLATFLMEEATLGKYQVLVGFLLLGQAFSSIALGPFLKNIFRFKEDEINKFKKVFFKAGLLFSVIFAALLMCLMYYVYQIELPLEFTLLIIAYLLPMYFFTIESHFLVKHEKEKELLKFTIIAAVVNFSLSFLLIPFWGIQGALISGILSKLILSKLVLRRFKLIVNSLG